MLILADDVLLKFIMEGPSRVESVVVAFFDFGIEGFASIVIVQSKR